MVAHRGCVNLYDFYACRYLKADDRILVVSSYSFDLTQKNLISPLILGAAVVLAPTGVLAGRQLLDLIRDEGIGLVNCAPSQFYDAISAGSSAKEGAPESLRYVVLGGAAGTERDRLMPWLGMARGQPSSTAMARRKSRMLRWTDSSKRRPRRGLHLLGVRFPIPDLYLRSFLQPVPIGVEEVHRRGRSGAGLSEPARADGRALYRRLLQRNSWSADVPHRRRGSVADRWGH